MDVFSKLLGNRFDELIGALNTELENMGADVLVDGEEDLDSMEIVVNHYCHLIESILDGKKPELIELNEEYCFEVKIEGKAYDLDEMINYDDEVNTERMMEIESLLCEDLCIEEIEEKINKRFAYR